MTVGPADPGDQAIRVFWNPTPFVANPLATYKILVNGRAGGFRHQSIVDFEAMFQKLGAENGFDVDIWDPNINQGPGPAGSCGRLADDEPVPRSGDADASTRRSCSTRPSV